MLFYLLYNIFRSNYSLMFLYIYQQYYIHKKDQFTLCFHTPNPSPEKSEDMKLEDN